MKGRFAYEAFDHPGARSAYHVADRETGKTIGTVVQREGGWWRARAASGQITTSWGSTRADAVETLVEWSERLPEIEVPS